MTISRYNEHTVITFNSTTVNIMNHSPTDIFICTTLIVYLIVITTKIVVTTTVVGFVLSSSHDRCTFGC